MSNATSDIVYLKTRAEVLHEYRNSSRHSVILALQRSGLDTAASHQHHISISTTALRDEPPSHHITSDQTGRGSDLSAHAGTNNALEYSQVQHSETTGENNSVRYIYIYNFIPFYIFRSSIFNKQWKWKVMHMFQITWFYWSHGIPAHELLGNIIGLQNDESRAEESWKSIKSEINI